MEQIIITRGQAIEQGLKRYFTGKPCPKGHIVERIVNGCLCSKCVNENSKLWKSKNPEACRKHARTTYAKNRVELNEKSKIRQRLRRKENPGLNKYNRDHYLKYKDSYILQGIRRKRKLEVSSFEHEKEFIRHFYKDCPKNHHVDHEIPLNHPLVCGLHVLANLQYLTVERNLAKSNSWNQDQYNSTS